MLKSFSFSKKSQSTRNASVTGNNHGWEVFITVVKAVLEKNFDFFGKMDPYVVIDWVNNQGPKVRIAQTNIHKKAHFNPVWNYICKPQSYIPGENGEIYVILSIYEKDVFGKDDLCGLCRTPVQVLLEDPVDSPYHVLPIFLKGEKSGTIYVTATLLQINSQIKETEAKTTSLETTFESPVNRLNVSGGTADFFELKLVDPDVGQSPDCYIGKDLLHAEDEYGFYESVMLLQQNSEMSNEVFYGLFDYMLSCKGVLNTVENDIGGPNSKKLLVMENLRDNCKKLRLIDIKIGSKTACAGWRGKSWIRAKKQQKFVDNMSNTSEEGFRLEGFDNPPDCLKSVYTVLDGHFLELTMSSSQAEKKLFRRHLQSLNGKAIMTFFTDLHHINFEDTIVDQKYYLFKEEYVEIVLNEVVKRLTRLSIICHKVMIPQKWIGSSVVLGFDIGALPLRSHPISTIQKNVKVKIIDWGRSDLNTHEKNKSMDILKHRNYTKSWKDYVLAIDRLSWEAARFYFNRYGNSNEWEYIHITLYDYDCMKADDEMGEVILAVEETESREHPVMRRGKSFGTLSCSLTWESYPSSSRFKGIWHLFIIEGVDLVNMDIVGFSDVYCEVAISARDGHCHSQYTSLRENTLTPVWNEFFQFPVLKDGVEFVQSTLENEGCTLGDDFIVTDLLTNVDGSDGFDNWVELVDNAHFLPSED